MFLSPRRSFSSSPPSFLGIGREWRGQADNGAVLWSYPCPSVSPSRCASPALSSHHKHCYPDCSERWCFPPNLSLDHSSKPPPCPHSTSSTSRTQVCSYSNADFKACYSVALTPITTDLFHPSLEHHTCLHVRPTPHSHCSATRTPAITNHSAPLRSKLSLPSLYSPSTVQVPHSIADIPHLAPRHLDPCSPSAGRY